MKNYSTIYFLFSMISACRWRHVDKRPWRLVTFWHNFHYIMCSWGGLEGWGGNNVLVVCVLICFFHLLRLSGCYAFNTFLELLRRSWCYAFNGCKTQLHSDGAKSWPKCCSQRAPKVEKKNVSHNKNEVAKKVRSRKKPEAMVAGTQCVDRWWQSLEKALPRSLHVKDRPGMLKS